MTPPPCKRRSLLQGLALGTFGWLCSRAAQAHEYTARHFTLIHPWADASAAAATTARVYFSIEAVEQEDRLLGATSDIAQACELRASLDDGAPALQALPVAVGERVDFSPGHPHVLLKGLRVPLREDRSYPLTLQFEQAGKLTVQVSVGAH